ncbi:amidohydrolase family protein [Steroidobacter sp. S1-65]|uniref:Amidohydrolase family protein n=1 Tax=Steroidobacter gossypii TaxID=2805490 RepID=A0ABS1WUW0_9GAMM|nr:amidohydrolase family protein [Steroidobacter gossypii]MBM0104758.1 amidohydrolase family protein [Steroidobacter gossypii]
MQVVDPHVHLWDLGQVHLPWLSPASVAYSGDNRLLPRTFTPSELRAGAGDVEVLKVINVEANPQDAVAETRWLQSLADTTGYPQGIVALVDLAQPDAGTALAAHAESTNLRGIRQILNVHSNPLYDYVSRHYMQDTQWRANLRLLARHKLSFDLQIYPSQAPLAAEVIRENPDIPFILNHAGMWVDRTLTGWREWRNGLRLLAALPNVTVKISGLVMFDHLWTIESLRPCVLDAIDAFGVERACFASNFPIDGLHANYAELWHAYADIVASASPQEQRALFVSNAERIYRV